MMIVVRYIIYWRSSLSFRHCASITNNVHRVCVTNVLKLISEKLYYTSDRDDSRLQLSRVLCHTNALKYSKYLILLCTRVQHPRVYDMSNTIYCTRALVLFRVSENRKCISRRVSESRESLRILRGRNKKKKSKKNTHLLWHYKYIICVILYAFHA